MNQFTFQSRLRAFWNDEDGIGTLEMILIVAVIVVIAVAFRKWIISWVQKLFDTANDEMLRTNEDTIIVPEAQ